MSATRLSDLVKDEDINQDFAAALPAAECLALKVIASYGALSSDDGFYRATSNFAEEFFGLDEARNELEAATDALKPYLPADKRAAFALVDPILCAANGIEHKRWEAMWLLGVCVGVRLGGVR